MTTETDKAISDLFLDLWLEETFNMKKRAEECDQEYQARYLNKWIS